MADLNAESTPHEVLVAQSTTELRAKYNDLALDLTRMLNGIQVVFDSIFLICVELIYSVFSC